ncbi:MAG: PQQ-dependent sugar dehydrogenase [Bacteroidota bacterium]|nr:PQQ-dependent sugar dehydrogenase [Bacteroidota bacterium]
MNACQPPTLIKGKINGLFLLLFLAFILLNLQLQAQSFPAGFTRVLVTSGIINPMAMAFAPDGRIFVGQGDGALKIIKNGTLLATPFLQLKVNSKGERGLLGIALDPNFTSNQYVYLCYTLPDGSRNRISRFKGNGDVVVPGSETIVLDLDPLGRSVIHYAGNMHFGIDGKLYVAVGENATPAHAQNLDTYHGKLLRINPDGSVPAGNPFSGSAQRSRVWAYGFRNPFTFDVQPGTGKIFVNDVGENTWEEINDATIGGKNFGWPGAEGNSSNSSFTDPFYAYKHGAGDGLGCAITGGVFFNPATTNYPSEYLGRYFFHDYCNNWINMLSISGGTVSKLPFATKVGDSPMFIDVGPDGNLYYLSRSSRYTTTSDGILYKIIYSNNPVPEIVKQPENATVSAGQPASFSVTATGKAPLKYQWQKNGVKISGATSATYTISSTTASNAGSYRVVVSNEAGKDISNPAKLTVTAFNNTPTAQILTPLENSLYRGSDTIKFSGSGSDIEDGTLPASAFSWSVEFHHDTHKHDGPPIASGVRNGYYVIPNTGEVSANVFYRILLTVKDSKGLTSTKYRDILPRKTTISLATQPAGLKVALGGQPVVTPVSVISVEGIKRTIGPVNSQIVNGKTYDFANWKHGGSATQTIVTPINNVTYTAIYKERPFNPLRLEAENATLSGVQVLSSQPGFTGRGFADYINASGDYVEWTVKVPHTGSYTISFRYALASNPRTLQIMANGTVINPDFSFPRTSTNDWGSWSNVTITANLNVGTNKIRATSIGNSGPNIDHIIVTRNTQATTLARKPGMILDKSAEDIILKPNPVRKYLTLDFYAEKGEKINVYLTSTEGKTIVAHSIQCINKGNNSFTLNTHNLSNGSYIVRLVKGKSTTSKVIIVEN